MSIQVVPPFSFVPTISEGVTRGSDALSLKHLRNVVAGRETTFPRSRAMAMLQRSDFPNKHRDFEAVLENEKESSDIRSLAAISLGKIATTAALAILVKNLHVSDERVLAGVMKALGRVGDRTTLDAILTAKTYATGLALREAEFATILIAHRMGLEKSEALAIETGEHLEPEAHCARPFRIKQADDADAELCLRSFAHQPFGIEFSETPIYQARCGRNTWMIALNREFSAKDCVITLGRRNAFFGVVALRSEQTRLYSAAFLLLTSPTRERDAVDILVYRPNGKLTFRGTARMAGSRAEFAIRSVAQPGAFAVKIEGAFADGALDIRTALAATFVQIKKREPIEE